MNLRHLPPHWSPARRKAPPYFTGKDVLCLIAIAALLTLLMILVDKSLQ